MKLFLLINMYLYMKRLVNKMNQAQSNVERLKSGSQSLFEPLYVIPNLYNGSGIRFVMKDNSIFEYAAVDNGNYFYLGENEWVPTIYFESSNEPFRIGRNKNLEEMNHAPVCEIENEKFFIHGKEYGFNFDNAKEIIQKALVNVKKKNPGYIIKGEIVSLITGNTVKEFK